MTARNSGKLTPAVTEWSDGSYRWLYELDMYHNPSMLYIWFKYLPLVFLALCVLALLTGEIPVFLPLLVMSLLYGVRITALNQQAAAAKASVEALREENEILRVRAADSCSLEEIERRAREELGMQSLSAEQIVRTDFAG